MIGSLLIVCSFLLVMGAYYCWAVLCNYLPEYLNFDCLCSEQFFMTIFFQF